jgi:hypothetical protein
MILDSSVTSRETKSRSCRVLRLWLDNCSERNSDWPKTTTYIHNMSYPVSQVTTLESSLPQYLRSRWSIVYCPRTPGRLSVPAVPITWFSLRSRWVITVRVWWCVRLSNLFDSLRRPSQYDRPVILPSLPPTLRRHDRPSVLQQAKWHVRVSKQSCKQGNRLILWGVCTPRHFIFSIFFSKFFQKKLEKNSEKTWKNMI